MFNLKPSLSDLLHSAFRSILKNKGRTFLTSLGIIIGVTSVILLVSIGNGLQSYITTQFESLGSNLVFVAPGRLFSRSGGFSSGAGNSGNLSFSPRDVSDITRALHSTAKYIIPLTTVPTTAKFGPVSKDATIVATTADYAASSNKYPGAGNGRWFTTEEDQKKSTVAVLGYQIAIDLFGNHSPLNYKIVVNGVNLKVIGVMAKQGGGLGGGNADAYIYIPLETGYVISGNQNIQEIEISVKNAADIQKTKDLLQTTLQKKYDKNSFTVFDSSQLLSSITSILGTLTVALSGIAAISLVVGGIGIMNIMLVTVSERTREIGLRKAIGAYPRAILIQFLIEAIILSSIGGAVGIALGALGTWAINSVFPAKITFQSILLAFGVSSAVGIIFGVAPARRASKLSPIEALRYE